MTKAVLPGCFLVVGCLANQAFANGITINEQSSSAAGTAYAGRSSAALDASTLFGNPAGLSKLTRTEVSGGLSILDSKLDISQASGGQPGTNKGDSVPLAAIPFGYYSTPLDDRFTFGIGFYVPSGLINDYEKSFQGRAYGSYSKLQVVTLQPTIAYRFNDRFSIGFGPTINRQDGLLKNTLATGALNNGKGDAEVKVRSSDTALGFNLGLLLDLDDATRWGLDYRSKVDYHNTGHTEISNAPAFLQINGRYDCVSDSTLPEAVDTSITHHFDERWTGYVGALWTRWSRLKAVDVNNSGMSPEAYLLGFGTLTEEYHWHDTWTGSVGVAYQLDPHWVLRGGYAYDPSPASNDNRSVRVPVGDRQALTVGAGWSPDADLTLDVAAAYLWEDTASVDLAGNAVQPAYKAKYDNSAVGLTAQLTYRY